jgi:antitoxin ParD1/3/4
MAASSKRTFSLPAEQAKFIDRLVESGSYASGSEVVRAGLRALQERDTVIERWLREDVVPVVKAMEADPTRGVSAKDVRKHLRAHHDRQPKTRAGGA